MGSHIIATSDATTNLHSPACWMFESRKKWEVVQKPPDPVCISLIEHDLIRKPSRLFDQALSELNTLSLLAYPLFVQRCSLHSHVTLSQHAKSPFSPVAYVFVPLYLQTSLNRGKLPAD